MLIRLALAGALALALIAIDLSIGFVGAFDNGQYKDVPPNIRNWFKSVRSPHGIPCCDISDGHRTTWRASPAGDYEVPIEGEWRRVPPDSVIYNSGNPTGEAVVWYVRQGANTYYIRCFVPGDGV